MKDFIAYLSKNATKLRKNSYIHKFITINLVNIRKMHKKAPLSRENGAKNY